MLSVFSKYCYSFRWIDLTLISVAVSLALVLIIYHYCTSTFDTWEKCNVPYIRPIPLFGNYLNVAFGIDHPIEAYKNIYYELAGHKYGGYFQMRTPYLMIRHPDVINQILVKDFWSFPKRGIYMNFDTDPLADNILFMEDQYKWKNMRSKLSPAFTSGKLKCMLDQVEENSKSMIESILNKSKENPHGIDIREILVCYTTDVIGTCVFGLNFDAVKNENSELRKYGRILFGSTIIYHIREIVIMISPKLLKIIRLPNFPLKATNFFRSLFKDTLNYRERNNIVRNDIVHYLIEARKSLVLDESLPKNEKCTELQIVANAFAMFSAGFETISTTTCYVLYELAFKKHIQEKVRKEINAAKLKHNGVINSEFLADLNYLDMVLAETLRKYPVVFGLFRETAERFQMPDSSLILEKGQKVMVPIFSLHNDPQYFTDPTNFDPERFLPGEKIKRPSGIYLPFGIGPRICIGKRFAEMEIKLALTTILSEFIVEPSEKTEYPIRFSNQTLLVIPKSQTIILKFISISS